MSVILYVLSIVIANVVTAAIAPIDIWYFIVPIGTFLIGGTFIFRDFVQVKHGKKWTYCFIAIAMIVSGIVSAYLGDGLWIVFASSLSFLISETADTEIYSRLTLPLSSRVWYSGLVGGALDSSVFVIVGLSPIGADFLPWSAVIFAILGQMIVKTAMQGIAAIIIANLTKGDVL